MPSAVWTVDPQLTVTNSLGGALPEFGLRDGEIVGRNLRDLFSQDQLLEKVVDIHQRALRGERFSYETRWRDRDLWLTMQPLITASGETHALGIVLDLTAQKHAERKYRDLFERNLAGVFRATISGKLVEANDAFAQIFGYSSASAILSVPTTDLYHSPADREQLIHQLKTRGEVINYELRLRRADGRTLWALMNERIVVSPDGGEDFLEGTLIDITDRKLAEQWIEYQAYHDSLTDLPNRFLLNDRLSRALSHGTRHQKAVAVLFLDLDRFKIINDTLSHRAGDELLTAISTRLSNCLRGEDTVARVGGDEFIFVLSELDASEAVGGAAKVAEKILAAIRQPLIIQDRELFITGSLGIAIAPHDGNDIETLLKNADSAMYRAKDAGRNQYQFHTRAAQQRAEVRLTLETALRHALDREEFFLVYQPQVELGSGKIVGFETLLRWMRPGIGIVYPAEFIPLAEEIGEIVPIGEWVLRTACKQMLQWHTQGFKDLRLAVNLSPRQFQHGKLTQVVEKVIEETGYDPNLLEFEITESLSIHNVDLTIGRLSYFKNLGIRASLDDFGTGYSSLGHLRFLPIDTVKIDRSFIKDLRNDGTERMIVQAIVRMAQSMAMGVVAEGVETEEQRQILLELGCDAIQGYLYSRPLTVEGVGVFLTESLA